jgi:AcrR family transcriptional regulator
LVAGQGDFLVSEPTKPPRNGRAATVARRKPDKAAKSKAVRSAGEPGEGGRAGTPAQHRELRAQGRETMQKLFDAGMQVFAERGYHASRVDDIVRVAETSHGTFYLYFTNKEDLLRALALDCAEEMRQLADALRPIGPGVEGRKELRSFLEGFIGVYRRYGPVIRAWMEGQAVDRDRDRDRDLDLDRVGVKAFTAIGSRLGELMREAGAVPATEERAAVAAVMAMLERFSYATSSRRLVLDDATVLDTLVPIIHRGFFGAPVAPTKRPAR